MTGYSDLPALRWGLVGASRIARNGLVPAFRATGQTLAAIAASDPARAKSFAEEQGIARVLPHYQALVDDRDIDAVYISLTNDAHKLWAVQALMVGKHVLCEKPLALNAAEVAGMRAAEAAGGGVLMEAFCHIFHPRFDDLEDALRMGRLGTLVGIEAGFSNPLRDPEDFRHSKALGGGAVYDLAGYCISLAWLLVGRMPVAVAARFQPMGEVDGSTALILDFGDVQASITASLTAAAQQRLTVNATGASITLDWPISNKNRPVALDLPGDRREYAPLDPYHGMVADFVTAASGRTALKFDSAHSLTQARIMDAVFAAAANQKTWVLT